VDVVSQRKLQLAPRSFDLTQCALVQKLSESTMTLATDVSDRPIAIRFDIEFEKPSRRFIGHDQSVTLVHNNDGVAQTVDDGLGTLLLPLSKLSANPQIAQFSSKLLDQSRVLVQIDIYCFG
jgi:hypothetical protein